MKLRVELDIEMPDDWTSPSGLTPEEWLMGTHAMGTTRTVTEGRHYHQGALVTYLPIRDDLGISIIDRRIKRI